MATERRSSCIWEGDFTDGSGRVTFESSATVKDLGVSWASRTEEPQGKTSPEELIAAAHAACFSMAFSLALGEAGTPPERLEVAATVGFEPGVGVTGSHLDVRGTVPGISKEDFIEAAEGAGKGCPVSQALAVDITVTAELTG